MTKITINNITLDPFENQVNLENLSLVSIDASQSNYILIQASEPLSKERRDALTSYGVNLLEYVPDNTYIARFNGDDLSRLRNLTFVNWVNIYLKGFKINPLLKRNQPNDSLQLMMSAEVGDVDEVGVQYVDIFLQGDIQAEDVIEKISQVSGINPELDNISAQRVRINLPLNRLNKVAEIDEVRHIEPVYESYLSNNVASKIINADKVHNQTPYTGTGQIVAVCDTGFDKGSVTNVHPAFKGRVKKLYDLGRAGFSNDPNGHGTHVAGSVLGNSKSVDYGQVQGTAPKAELILQSVLDSKGGLGGLPSDLNDLFTQPYKDGARVHTNSWGSTNSNGRYSAYSRNVDEFVWNNRDFVICFAAGNPGTDSNGNGVVDLGSIQAPGTAKNCITVGASESERPNQSKKWKVFGRYPVDPIANDLWADDPSGMAAFSGRGPTSDQRIKPDVVAPGTSILSTCSRDDLSVSDFWGTSTDSLYCYMGGTSMATPLVAGCAAVIREYLEDQGIVSPSAALIKALLVNGAIDMGGQYSPSETGRIPNHSEGFGRIDLARTIENQNGNGLIYSDEAIELDTGEDYQETFSVPADKTTVKVTLVWTDPPGESLQNDLDLIVENNGYERHGNMSPSSTKFDRTNNVEQVEWQGVSGEVKVTVKAYRVALYAQNFALVIRFE